MSAVLYDPPGSKNGTAGDDYLSGTDGSNILRGYAGNDWLRAYAGSDSLYGHEGNDLLDGGSGSDHIDGGLHNDTVTYFNSYQAMNVNLAFGTGRNLAGGYTENDTLVSIENVIGSFYGDTIQGTEIHNKLEGMAGADVVLGWGGDDRIEGGFGNDFLVGGEGNDTVSGGFDTDTLQGNNGIDTLDYAYSYQGMDVSLTRGDSRTTNASYYTDNDSLSGFENITGSFYSDRLEGDGLGNVIDGGTGDDLLSGLAGDDRLIGGEGTNFMEGGAGRDAFIGGSGKDTASFIGSATAVKVDLLTGIGTLGESFGDTYSGIEVVLGSNAGLGDTLTGDNLDNWLEGNAGNDGLFGNGGQDRLSGGRGIDFLNGGEGNDRLRGGEDQDLFFGGNGYDLLDMNPDSGGIGPVGPGVTVNLSTNSATDIDGNTESVFTMEGVIGTSFDDSITGDAGVNYITGGMNQDTLRGLGANDLLFGETGNDVVIGDAGNDHISGGMGVDFLIGGSGGDRFVFSNVLETGTATNTQDVIGDFFQGDDLIVVSGIDANASVAGDQAFSFIGSAGFSGAAQLRAVLSGGNTLLQGEVTGDSVADFQIALNGQFALTQFDFTL